MKIRGRTVSAVLVGLVLAGALASCGGADKSASKTTASVTSQTGPALGTLGKGAAPIPANAVAQVGSALITRAELSHWMGTLLGGDLYESKHVVAPKGLVSDPESLPRCVASIKRFIAGSTIPTPAKIENKCKQLHAVLKNQALTSLIQYRWDVARNAKLGLKVEPGDVQRLFAQVRAKEFPTAQKLNAYLARRGWTVADELFLVRRDLLGAMILKKLAALGGPKGFERFTSETNELEKAKTSCRPAYVVEPCREFTSAPAEPGPNVILGEIADWKAKARG
jgi:hypothetical protein